jgi:deazaflavin-dependent oxidoreductase (nitroreductase family)
MSNTRTPRQFERGRWYKTENTMMSALTRAGLIPHTYLLTTTGRRSGQPRSNPVTVVKVGSKRWLVAPYGAVSWVRNARAAGEVRLTRRKATGRFAVREVSAEEAGPVLKQYADVAVRTREYFAADRDAPAEAFAVEADRHPVFELIPLGK